MNGLVGIFVRNTQCLLQWRIQQTPRLSADAAQNQANFA
jgi:hypothetical protein